MRVYATFGYAVRLLLINPRSPESFWSFKWAVDNVLPGKRAVNPPLGLATVAALTPPHWRVDIVDENIESVPLDPDADVIGIGGMGVQFERQVALLAYYRKRGHHVVAGGSFASLCPERYADLADTIVAGEAEYQWPRFCADFERGRAAPLYRETGVVDLADSPLPRFDLLKLDRYSTATLQFSRGCPFLCEFCDIIVMFGRKPRAKSVPQVERELDVLRAAGVRNVFFVDDNLIGNPKLARELLDGLARYQKRHGYAFQFGTEASINLALDADLLAAMRQAGFGWVFVGIESPNPDALKEVRKTQNLRQDVRDSVRTLHAHGIDVLAGLIVGFDNDTLASFDEQYRFVVDSGIQAAMIGLLTALPHTPLHARLAREGRLRESVHASDNTKLATNVTPKGMRYEELIEGYRGLYRRLVSDRAIAQRVRTKMRHVGTPVYQSVYDLSQQVGIVARLLARGILPGGPRRTWLFVGSLPWLAPRKLQMAIVDWIAGLSMQQYVRDHFGAGDVHAQSRVARRLSALRRALAEQVRAGQIAFSAHAAQVHLSLRLDRAAGRRAFRRIARRLDRVLLCPTATLTLEIERLLPHDVASLQSALSMLQHHGERVRIVVSEHLRHLLAIDSSRFHLVLQPPTP